jgi:hypothetical protein
MKCKAGAFPSTCGTGLPISSIQLAYPPISGPQYDSRYESNVGNIGVGGIGIAVGGVGVLVFVALAVGDASIGSVTVGSSELGPHATRRTTAKLITKIDLVFIPAPSHGGYLDQNAAKLGGINY